MSVLSNCTAIGAISASLCLLAGANAPVMAQSAAPADQSAQHTAQHSAPDAAHAAHAEESAAHAAILAAVESATRTPANRTRDEWRHPVETLSFFGLNPGDTVVELWPGTGWYSEILSAHARAGGGRLFAAGPWERGLNGVRRMQQAQPDMWGGIALAEFPAIAGSGQPAIAPGSADLVVTFRNVHNWRFGGTDNTAQAFQQIFAMLKPGGRLGVVDHRLPEDMPSAMEENSGYMKRSSIIAFATAAGFTLAGESEVNANPRDTHDHPRGVWTLPPVSRGAAEDPNRDQYTAIGESDRMTLLFVKPLQ
ncbi:MAG: class I SAM-dependent methyltransferase [Sphingopyxis sp.]